MKRAMGLLLGVLAFAVAAHADRMEYGGSGYATTADLRSQATSTEPLLNSNLLTEPGSLEFRADGALSEPGDSARLTDHVFHTQFADSATIIEDSAEFDAIGRQLNGFRGVVDDARGKSFGIEHPDPFRRVLAVMEVPEPGTLLLVAMGIVALAFWKQRRDHSERAI
jgi:PEP-CTERM motif